VGGKSFEVNSVSPAIERTRSTCAMSTGAMIWRRKREGGTMKRIVKFVWCLVLERLPEDVLDYIYHSALQQTQENGMK
jgi:hypothetical protein